MPRIAIFVATSGHSGVDRLVRNLAPAIAERGIDVDVLRVRNHGPRMDASQHEHLRIVELGASHAYTAVGPLIRYLRRERPDALLSDKDRVNRVAIVSHIIARSRARLVVRTGTTVSHNLASRRRFDRFLNRWSMQNLYDHADAIVLPSHAAAEDFSATIGIPCGRITVCPSPIATPDLYARATETPQAGLVPSGGGPLIVGIGELSERKDFATALRAFARIDPEWDARLVILGEGEERHRLLALAEALGVAQRFSLPGFVNNPYPLLAQADAFVHAARLEGLPVAVVEAVALGRAVVCTDCPSGPREILQDGRLGRLVPVGDDIAMGDALVSVLDARPPETTVRTGAIPFSLQNSVDAYLRVLGFDPASWRAPTHSSSLVR